MDITKLTALELGEKIQKKEVGVREATAALLTKIDQVDGNYHAYLSVFNEQALDRADDVQKKINSGEYRSPLAGVPVALKDNICTKGQPTTCASKFLEEFRPPYDATVVEKLDAAGAVVVGKLNMDEFAMGSTSETSYFEKCCNPWNTDYVPGGSSGGAAAAVAAEEAFYALGSDTGGSIRQPSSFCGVTGIKPTYGAVSRYGVVAYASSLDQVGPIAHTASDLAATLDIIAGKDERDAVTANTGEGGYLAALSGDIKGLKVGIPSDYFGEGLDNEVKEKVLAAAKELEKLGAHVEELRMPLLEYAIPAFYIIASAEASSNLSRYDGVKYGYRTQNAGDLYELYLASRSEGFGMEVKRRIMLGNFVLSSGYYDAYYKKALQAKALIKADFDKAFSKYDVLISPVAPSTAPKRGESLNDPLKMYLRDVYTVSVNLTGLPGISVPCGFDTNGMPVGYQLIGSAFNEKTLLNAAHAYQTATDFHLQRPQTGRIS